MNAEEKPYRAFIKRDRLGFKWFVQENGYRYKQVSKGWWPTQKGAERRVAGWIKRQVRKASKRVPTYEVDL